jgi:hypothetical protein
MIIEVPKPKNSLVQKYKLMVNIALYLLILLACCTFLGYNLFPVFTRAIHPPMLTITIISSFELIFCLILILTLITLWKQRKYLWAEIQCEYTINIDNNTFTVNSDTTGFYWRCMLDEIEEVYIVVTGGIVIKKKKSLTKKIFARRIEKEKLIDTVEFIKRSMTQRGLSAEQEPVSEK